MYRILFRTLYTIPVLFRPEVFHSPNREVNVMK